MVSQDEWRRTLAEQRELPVWLMPAELPRQQLAQLGLPFDASRADESLRAELMVHPSTGRLLAVRASCPEGVVPMSRPSAIRPTALHAAAALLALACAPGACTPRRPKHRQPHHRLATGGASPPHADPAAVGPGPGTAARTAGSEGATALAWYELS